LLDVSNYQARLVYMTCDNCSFTSWDRVPEIFHLQMTVCCKPIHQMALNYHWLIRTLYFMIFTS